VYSAIACRGINQENRFNAKTEEKVTKDAKDDVTNGEWRLGSARRLVSGVAAVSHVSTSDHSATPR
jgi:hypothetical protein